jgi:peptidoglycan hydrolase CwlO-like protein
MARRVRLTSFTRFLLVMIVLVPAAYIGASYYNGEDGIQNIKNLLGIGKSQPTVQVETNRSPRTENTAPAPTNKGATQNQLEQLNRKIEEMEREQAALRERINQQDLQIKELRRQLNARK